MSDCGDFINDPRNHTLNLEKNIEELLREGRIGLSYITSKDVTVVSNTFVERTTGYTNYHYLVKVPYAGKRLNWEIIFNPEDYSTLPDFDFNDDTFLPEPEVDYIVDNVPSWKTWNLEKPNAIISILNEFLDLYKKAQVEKLAEENMYSRHRKEYEDLIKYKNVKSENVEVYIENHLNFLISLPVDCRLLPEFIQSNDTDAPLQNPGGDYVSLQITFLKLDNTHTKAVLQLSPRLDQILGKLSIPEYKTNTTLLSHVKAIEEVIHRRMLLIAEQYQKKTEFVMSLASSLSSSVIEYDTEMFSRIVFMYDVDEYDCVVSISLGAKFPQDKPKIELFSIYCQDAKQCNTILDNFFYDPADSVEKMINKILRSLKDGVVNFQNHKH